MNDLADALSQLGYPKDYRRQSLSSGSQQRVERLIFSDGQSLVLKQRPRAAANFFAAEAAGLELLGRSAAQLQLKLRTLKVLHTQQHFILLEDIAAQSATEKFWQQFGHDLAALHRHQGSERHGLASDNYIGSRPQSNAWLASWPEFFAHHRLRPRLKLLWPKLSPPARQQATHLLDHIQDYLPAATPSLLHGDLWGGNFLVAAQETPVLIDPAVYFGHSEADLAMSQLFGGFVPTFYQSYYQVLPPPTGYQQRYRLYNLYHLCNHWLSFGDSYRAAVLDTLACYS